MSFLETVYICYGDNENVHIGFLMELELVLTKIQHLNLVIFRQLLYSRIWSLWNRPLLQFSIDSFQTLYTCCGHREDVKVRCLGAELNFARTTVFLTSLV